LTKDVLCICKDDDDQGVQHGISVSIIVACRNEERFIGRCLDSIIANDYPKERLQVLVVDGMSDDRTREIVEEYLRQYPFIRMLNNPKKIIPCAWNTGIRNAKGEIVGIVSAHSTCETDFVSQSVKYLLEYSADRVGGRIITVPRDNTLMGKAISLALSLPFGVGNARFRTVDESAERQPVWVDTVPFWFCRRELFDKVGLFNEYLTRSEDIEHSMRLRRQGYKTLLVPSIVSVYYARSDLKSFWKHNVLNGIWAILPFNYTSDVPVSLRHLVPLAFVGSVASFGVLSLMMKFFVLPFLLVLGSYCLVNAGFSTAVAIREKDARLIFAMPVAFGALHIGYGLGSLIGLARFITMKLGGIVGSEGQR